MRPRPEGRGERRSGRCSAGTTSGRFNAATTRRPWRTRPQRRSTYKRAMLQCGHDPKAVENAPINPVQLQVQWLQCGHDPKAVENLRFRTDHQWTCGASMRPRPEGRGERVVAQGAGRRRRRFNAATTRRPWRTTARRGRVVAGVDASMRPRPEGRGELPSPRRQPVRPQASMRPRPEGRGELRSFRFLTFSRRMLQCGHDPKAVENRSL